MPPSHRDSTIARLRELLLAFDRPDHSLCQVMGRYGLYCRGFGAWDEAELRERFHWFCGARSRVDRAEIEDLADRWQRADTDSRGLSLPCDLASAAPPERLGCTGWERFGDGVLEAYLAELEAWLEEHEPEQPRDAAG